MTDRDKVIQAVREFLWLGVCWNDHNFSEGTVTRKCRELCADLDVHNVEQANALLATFDHDEQVTK